MLGPDTMISEQTVLNLMALIELDIRLRPLKQDIYDLHSILCSSCALDRRLSAAIERSKIRTCEILGGSYGEVVKDVLVEW